MGALTGGLSWVDGGGVQNSENGGLDYSSRLAVQVYSKTNSHETSPNLLVTQGVRGYTVPRSETGTVLIL